MKNPLIKRLPRELADDIGKYLVIFLFMTGLIALVSGFLVADTSMIAAYYESFEKYNIEDGNFELSDEADQALWDAVEDQGLTLYKNFYIEEETGAIDSTLRIFQNREEVNKVCLMSGELPDAPGEIAVDRMYADNNEIAVGDILDVAGRELTVVGLVALSDYSALFSSNSDMMFDAIKFGVAVMTPEGFDAFGTAHLHYSYSWKYDVPPENDVQAKELGDSLMKMLAGRAPVVNFVPEYSSQAIHFTGDDMGGDKAMMTILLYIVIAIMAFVFAVTTGNTIAKEAAVIGTLRASGYARGELVRHYLTMPVLVTLLGAVAGNVLGYTWFKSYFSGMYYSSYSLPSFETRWNPEAFLLTTVVPILIMLVINLFLLTQKLRLSPLSFLRHELSHSRKKRAFRLNPKLRFFSRFRIRIIFQNLPNYAIMFVGIFFANLILLFGLMLSPLLDHYQNEITSNLLCEYQYILKAQAPTDTGGAEAYCAGTLKTLGELYPSEEITLYGIQEDSRYIALPFQGDGVYLSESCAEKYKLAAGDTITLKEPYGDKEYRFEIAGVYDYPAALAVFMSQDAFNEVFEQEEGYFNGYFSDEEITDIDERFIASVITLDDLTKVSRQLQHSFDGIVYLFVVFGVVMFLLLIYLLSKIIIEKNAQSISMTKILGYSNGEIGRLYVLATTIVVILSLIITMPLTNQLIKAAFEYFMFQAISGWIPYYVPGDVFAKMLALGIVSYAVVAVMQLRKLKRIPMGDALKHVE